MKSIFPFAGPIVAVFVVLALTGCATVQDAQHQQHHPESATSQAPGAMSSGPSDMPMGMMDMKAMCDMHEKMMNAKTPEERRAMMDERMKNMSPEMMQKHMEMMQEQCKR
jgi:hypothetical protein